MTLNLTDADGDFLKRNPANYGVKTMVANRPSTVRDHIVGRCNTPANRRTNWDGLTHLPSVGDFLMNVTKGSAIRRDRLRRRRMRVLAMTRRAIAPQ